MKHIYSNEEDSSLAFPLTYLKPLQRAHPDLEVGISYYIVEQYEDGVALKELRIDYTTPTLFDLGKDL
jgi:hypothetical protein